MDTAGPYRSGRAPTRWAPERGLTRFSRRPVRTVSGTSRSGNTALTRRQHALRTVRAVPPDIPAAKRAGLPVDLARLSAEGDGWLTPEDRYALKTHGVCAQLQAGRFMIRVRVPGGVLPTDQARGLARLARRHGSGRVPPTPPPGTRLHPG